MGKLQKNGLVPYKCICGQVITDFARQVVWMDENNILDDTLEDQIDNVQDDIYYEFEPDIKVISGTKDVPIVINADGKLLDIRLCKNCLTELPRCAGIEPVSYTHLPSASVDALRRRPHLMGVYFYILYFLIGLGFILYYPILSI